MSIAKAKIIELLAIGGIEVARQYAELYGESFPVYVAQTQWDYFMEQLLENADLRDKFDSVCKNEYQYGWSRKCLEIDMLSGGRDNIEIGDFGSAHRKWLEIYQPSVYKQHANNANFRAYLARYDLRARTRANVCMNFAMRYAKNAVPDESSQEWQVYILKLRSLARDYIRQTSPML